MFHVKLNLVPIFGISFNITPGVYGRKTYPKSSLEQTGNDFHLPLKFGTIVQAKKDKLLDFENLATAPKDDAVFCGSRSQGGVFLLQTREGKVGNNDCRINGGERSGIYTFQ